MEKQDMTATQIADALGRTRIAEAMGNTAGAITMTLKQTGKFPARYYKVICKMAGEAGIEQPPLSAFNFIEQEDEG